MPKALTRQAKLEQAQLENFRQLLAFDRKQRFKGRSNKPLCFLVGTDEVGRGCFAGPVVAAAVMLPEIKEGSLLSSALVELNDSKLVRAPQREKLAAIIHEVAICAIAESTVEEINEINILRASLLAMRRALDAIVDRVPETLPALVLVDGNRKVDALHAKYLQNTVIGGDSTSASIAAASIIAKVHRDRFMADLATKHPQYGWEQNKGYGSPAHRAALLTHGMTKWHRTVFCQNFLSDSDDIDYDELSADHADVAELAAV